MNKTSILNSLLDIEFDRNWLEAQTIGPGPTTTMTTTVNTTEKPTGNSTQIPLIVNINVTANLYLPDQIPTNNSNELIEFNTTDLLNFNITEFFDISKTESINENSTKTLITSTENTFEMDSTLMLPDSNSFASPKITKNPSLFEGIMKPAIFDRIPNASLLIATGLSKEVAAMPVEIHDLHYSSSVMSCQNLEPYYYKKSLVKSYLSDSKLFHVLVQPKLTTAKSNDMISMDGNSVDVNSTDANSIDVNSTGVNSTASNSTGTNSTGANSPDMNTTNVNSTGLISTEANSTEANSTEANSNEANSNEAHSNEANSTEANFTEVDSTNVNSTDLNSNNAISTTVNSTYPDSPLHVWGASGGLMLDQHPILCGGLFINEDPNLNIISNECHSIESGKAYIITF